MEALRTGLGFSNGQGRGYHSIARKMFAVERLPDGALPVYDGDDAAAFAVCVRCRTVFSLDSDLEAHDDDRCKSALATGVLES